MKCINNIDHSSESGQPETSSAYHGFLLLLKIFQRVGYFLPIKDLPVSLIDFISEKAAVKVSKSELLEYEKSGSKKRHLKVIREYLRGKAFDQKAFYFIKGVMEDTSQSKDDPVDLIN